MNKFVLFIVSIFGFFSSYSTAMSDGVIDTTDFLNQKPTSEQLIEALKNKSKVNFRGMSVEPIRTKVLLNITFEYDSDKLTPEAIKTLTELGKALINSELKNDGFLLEGHTDAKGSEKYNHELSKKRATAVYNYLITSQNIDPKRLKPVGKGETELLNIDIPESAENRRVEVINIGNAMRLK